MSTPASRWGWYYNLPFGTQKAEAQRGATTCPKSLGYGESQSWDLNLGPPLWSPVHLTSVGEQKGDWGRLQERGLSSARQAGVAVG